MCRCISRSPVPLNDEQRFKFAMSTYTWAASHWDQRWTCVLWNHWVKWSWCGQAAQSTSTRMNKNQPTNQNRPIKEKQQQLNNQPNNPSAVQLANIETNCSHKINQQTYSESLFF